MHVWKGLVGSQREGLPCPKRVILKCPLWFDLCSVKPRKEDRRFHRSRGVALERSRLLFLDQTGIWERADVRRQSWASVAISCESTCVTVALLLPCSGWGTASADIPAAADPTAAHLWTLHRAVGNMAVLTWPADQSCGRHRTLQLGGGGEGVGDAPHSTVGQLALGGLGTGGGRAELDVRRAPWRVSSFKRRAATNLLDGVVLNDAGALAGLVVVVVLQGRSTSLRLLQLLRHELLRF